MTDAERKLLLALAEHIQDWLSDQNVQGRLDAEIREIRELAKIVSSAKQGDFPCK